MAASILLVAPALLFLAVIFILPIGAFLVRAVDNGEIRQTLSLTLDALQRWDRQALPDETAFAALAADLRRAAPDSLTLLARRLNYVIPGYRSLVLRTAERLRTADAPLHEGALIGVDRRWGERAYWAVLKNDRQWLTPFFFLSALDLAVSIDGDVVDAPPERAIYRDVFLRTLWISAGVTVICLAIGFPVAWVLAATPPRISNVLMIFVLLPFWSSALVRTTAWVVLLQREGLVNQLMMWLGVVDEPAALIFNRAGVFIAMSHVLLPFLILPLYSVMKGVPPDYMRAAAGLGAPPVIAFLRVYLPQVMPGVVAGCSLVFVIALGFYVTPILVGGPGDQMISYFVAFYTNESVNWGMAAALGALLLVAVAVSYLGVGRLIGFDRLKVR